MGLNSEVLVMERKRFLINIPNAEIKRIIQNGLGGKVFNIDTTSQLITIEVSPTIFNEFDFQQKKKKIAYSDFLEKLAIDDYTANV